MLLYDTIEKMGKVADEFRDKYHLNYPILATPSKKVWQEDFYVLTGMNLV